MKFQFVILWVVTPCGVMISYITTWCHNPEDHDLNRHRFENLRSQYSFS